MEMIGHYAIPLQYPTTLFAGLKQAFLKRQTGAIIYEQILPVIATVDNVIHPVGSFNA